MSPGARWGLCALLLVRAATAQADRPHAIPVLRRAPAPVIAILGSSTAFGVGASSVSTSWVGRLTAYLQGLGVQVRNVSVPGSNTADSLARFDRDVRPLNPDFVVLATSIVNEAAINDMYVVRQVFTANTRLLIQKVEAIGAVPILITPYPQAIFNPSYRTQMLAIARDLEAEGVPVWDFWNVADDGSGRWQPGLSTDGTHPTDAGHLALFQALELGFFGYALDRKRPFLPRGDLGAWLADDGATAPAIAVRPASAAASWAAAFWVAPGDAGRSMLLLNVSGSGAGIRRSGSVLQIIVAGRSVAAWDTRMSSLFQHVCLSYSNQTGRLTLYVNGIQAGQAIAPGLPAATLFSLGSTDESPGVVGETLAQFLVYRTPLCAEDVLELASGHIPVKSLAASLPLAQSPSRAAQNSAPTNVDVTVGGFWHWVQTGPRVAVLDSYPAAAR
jgi:lysophospholipase L1-like esterase